MLALPFWPGGNYDKIHQDAYMDSILAVDALIGEYMGAFIRAGMD